MAGESKKRLQGTRQMIDYLEDLGYTVKRASNRQSDKTRGLTTDRIWQKLYRALDRMHTDTGMWYDPIDLYWETGDEGSTLRALLMRDGDYYLSSLEERGDSLMVGDPVHHSPSFAPVQRQTRIMRLASGAVEFIDIMSVAVVNKDDEIDSTELYDNMIKRAEESGDYPVRMFYHMGDSFQTGEYTHLLRVGTCYIGRGRYDLDQPLAHVEMAAIENNPENWGLSIGYDPYERGSDVVLRNGKRLPVYTDGFHAETSVLRTVNACSYFTSTGILTKDKKRMAGDTTIVRSVEPTERQLDDLVHLFVDAGKTQEDAIEFLTTVELVNERSRTLVHRAFEGDEGADTDGGDTDTTTDSDTDSDVEVEVEVEAEVDTDEGGDPDTDDIEVDEDLMAEIVNRAVAQIESRFAEQIQSLEQRLETAQTERDGYKERLERAEARVTDLEAEDVEKIERRKAETPKGNGKRRRITSVVRPSKDRSKADNGGGDAGGGNSLNFEDRANKTTSKMRSQQPTS